MTELDKVTQLCQTLRFQGNSERELQDALEPMLKSAFSEVTREAELTAEDRVDFLVGNIAVEIKIKGSPTQVTRQLQRYAKSNRVNAIVLVTTRSQHQALPLYLCGKTVRVVWLHPF